MKKLVFAAMAAATLFLSAYTVHQAVNWQIAAGYSIRFTGKDAEGVFSKMTGDILFDEKDLASSKFSVSIDVASINTGNGMKNKHAKKDKWFDADKYPTINFTSTKFLKSGNGYEVEGTLDMHGVKKQVVIPFTFSNNIFSGSFSVNRMDYGGGSMEGMSKKVSNEIELDLTVPVSKK